MARKWSDISREMDSLPGSSFWTPDTPDFLEKRARRQAERTRPPVSYTQAKAAIRANSTTRRTSVSRTRTSQGSATIIEFERSEHPASSRRGDPAFPGTGRTRRSVSSRGSAAARAAGSVTASAGQRQAARPSDGWERHPPRQVRHSADEAYGRQRRAARSEEREPEAPGRKGAAGWLRQMRHDARQRKADRAFDRNYQDAPAKDEGPRAALYEGRMGRTHARATRMQGRASTGLRAPSWLRFPDIPILDSLVRRPHFAAVVFTLACVVFSACTIYPGAQQSYIQMRMNEQAQAEYQAVLERNQELGQRIEMLQTDEGMAQLAHESLGWVEDGEHSVSVVAEGSSDLTADSPSEAGSVLTGSVPAPTTWYSPALDALFGYEG